VAVEGIVVALGGGIKALGIGVKGLGAGGEEAIEGVIMDTMPGAYFFAFSKNPSSSERGQAREELTFSQSTSSRCN
jgi:CobQ-like glutamine amidotransferase family enzyme